MFEPFPKIRMKALLAGASLVCFDICSYGRLERLELSTVAAVLYYLFLPPVCFWCL